MNGYVLGSIIAEPTAKCEAIDFGNQNFCNNDLGASGSGLLKSGFAIVYEPAVKAGFPQEISLQLTDSMIEPMQSFGWVQPQDEFTCKPTAPATHETFVRRGRDPCVLRLLHAESWSGHTRRVKHSVDRSIL